MSNGDIVVPPTDLTTAAIAAVDLILSQLGISPLDILESLFSGKPQLEDTDNVIAAYNQSAYWPLHALAADLQIAANNGAPISDSRAAIQAQFGVWKQGTVTSIQTFAGGQAGPGQPGYWTIFALIEQSWKASGQGEQAVLQYVKALDALTQVLAQQNGTQPPPPAVPPPTPAPVAPPCPPFTAFPDCLPQPGSPDQALDEVGQGFAGLAYWLQILAIYAMNLFQKGGAQAVPNGTTTDPVTCAQLTGLFNQLITAIGSINISVPPAPPSPEPPAPVDLTAVIAALDALVAAVKALGPFDSADLHTIAESFSNADALATAVVAQWATLFPGDPGTSQLVLS